jgi:hypothetical protein
LKYYKDKTLAKLIYNKCIDSDKVLALDWIVYSNPRPRILCMDMKTASKIVSYIFFGILVGLLFCMVYFVFPHIEMASFKIGLGLSTLMVIGSYIVVSKTEPGYLARWNDSAPLA